VSIPRVVVLASGTGSLLQALIDESSNLNIDIAALISDGEVAACDRARGAGIRVVVHEMQSNRNTWNAGLLKILHDLKPDLIVSAGFMKILDSELVAEFSGRIINTHPALLPDFPGAHAVRDALSAGVRVTGSTIHFVDAGVDTGPVIAQHEIEIRESDSEESLHERIKVEERKLLISVVRDLTQGKVRLVNGEVVKA
jgi:phosphoribosylglycinamide formyltransferase-1